MNNSQTDEVKSALVQLRFMRGHLLEVFAWPIACFALSALIWIVLLAQLKSERTRVDEDTRARATSTAEESAQQLSRTFEQLDSLTRTLAFYWTETHGQLRLERQADHGLFPEDAEFAAFAFDKNGNPLTSLKPFPKTINVAKRPDFQAHKNAAAPNLRVQFLSQAQLTGKPAVLFSRPLKSASGAFEGVVYVMVPPKFLAPSFEETRIGANDVLAIVNRDGTVVFFKAGKNVSRPDTLATAPAVFPRPNGLVHVLGNRFRDGRPRFVSWDSAKEPPFVAVVALDEDDLMAHYVGMRRDYLGMGVGASFIFFLVAVAGSVSSIHLLWRKHQAALTAQTFRLAIDGANEGFFMARALYGADRQISDFVVESSNEHGAKMVGYTKDALTNARFSQLFPNGQFHRVLDTYRLAMRDGFYEDNFKSYTAGQLTWTHRRLVRSGHGIAITLRDITEAKAHELTLRSLATTDSLTGLYNRYWLTNRLPEILVAATKINKAVAILYLDLDNFKDVNNTLGHDAGDEVLRVSAQRIKGVLRQGDQVARLGGDEFVVVVTNIKSPSDPAREAERIIAALASPITLASSTIPAVRTSVGICMFPDHASTAEQLLTHADTAMYAAKEAGRGCISFYTAELTSHIVKRVALEQCLREAIERREFVLHYQPRVCAMTGALRSMEALVRWQHPTRGLISPVEFIPLAEETGLIVEIGRQVLESVCEQIGTWQATGLATVPVSVNISAVQFEKSDLVSLVSDSLQRFGLHPATLELEITESCMMHDIGDVNKKLLGLKSLGLKLSVDDFGTGYSSLAQLQSLDMDVLKIDRMFTSTITDGRHGRDFFKTILSMANALQMEVVAEGVETAEELAILQALGCDEIQGYYVSHPVDAKDAASFFSARHAFRPFRKLDVLSDANASIT